MDKKGGALFWVFAILAVMAVILGVYWLTMDEDAITNYEDILGVQFPDVNSPAIIFQNVTLYDSTVFDPETNVCNGFRYGMNITVSPCITQDVDGSDIQHYVDFKWQGGESKNVSWIFVYDGELERGRMDLLSNVSHMETKLVNVWVNDHLVEDVLSYEDLGSPTGSCQIGNQNNTQMFEVIQSGENETEVETVYCFTDLEVVSASSFLISGNVDLSRSVEVWGEEWVDVTNSIDFLGVGLLDDDRSYYRVQDTTFNPDQTYKTRWTYTPKDAENLGKWHILGYETEVGLVQSVIDDVYIYLDPWWDSSWVKKRNLNLSEGYSIINFTYIAEMNAGFSDFRVIDYATETTEGGYWIQESIASNRAIIHLADNSTQKFYYDNSGATYTGDIQDVYSGIRHYYPLDETSGTVGTDGVATSNATSLNGGGWTDGKIFGGHAPGGSTSADTGFNLGSVSIDRTLSFSFWVMKLATLSGYPTYIGADGAGGVGSAGEFKCYSNNDDISCAMHDGSSAIEANAPDYPDDVWVLITLTYNGTTTKLYYNDTEVASGVINWNASLTAENTFLFSSSDGGNNIDDIIFDDVRFYNHSLSQTEIDRLYWSAINTTYTLGDVQEDAGISISLTSPTDTATVNDLTVDFNSTITLADLNVSNATIYVWDSGDVLAFTQISVLSGNETTYGNFSYTFPSDDTYTWGVYGCGFKGASVFCELTSNDTFTIDTSSPVISIISPTTNELSVASAFPHNVTLNATSADARLDACWYSNSQNYTNVTYTCNSTIGVGFLSYGEEWIFVYANDTGGNLASDSVNVTIATFSQSQSQSAITEGSSAVFTLIVNMTNIPSTTAYFKYNNTVYPPSTESSVQNATTFTRTLAIPVGFGNSTGITQYWNWTFNVSDMISDATTTAQTQTVYDVDFDDCSTHSVLVYNFTLYDEETKELVNETAGANIQVDFTWTSNAGVEFQESFEKDNNDTLLVCVPDNVLNQTNYSVDLVAEYSSTDRVTEFYYIDGGTVSESTVPNVIHLHDLLTADSTTFLFTYLDENGLEIPNAIVETLRYYIGGGVFTEVERSREDDNGETHIHLVEEDVIYKFRVTDENELIFTSSEIQAKCLSSPCSIELSSVGEYFGIDEGSWDSLEDGSYSISKNEESRQIILAFASNESAYMAMNLTIYGYAGEGRSAVASGAKNATSGTITLTVPQSYGNSSYVYAVYQNDELIVWNWFDLVQKGTDFFGNTLGVILTAFIVLALGLMAVTEGVAVIVFLLLGLILAGMLNLIDLGWIALISLVGAGGIIIWKLTKGGRR